MPKSTTATPQCAPWCRTHNDATAGGLLPADPGDGICTTTIPAGDSTARLTWNPLDGLAIRFDADELTLPEFAQLARGLDALIGAAA